MQWSDLSSSNFGDVNVVAGASSLGWKFATQTSALGHAAILWNPGQMAPSGELKAGSVRQQQTTLDPLTAYRPCAWPQFVVPRSAARETGGKDSPHDVPRPIGKDAAGLVLLVYCPRVWICSMYRKKLGESLVQRK